MGDVSGGEHASLGSQMCIWKVEGKELATARVAPGRLAEGQVWVLREQRQE